jgi:hypothetical protein
VFDVEVYTNSIKEIVAEDNGLSWKYIITDSAEEGIIIEYWEKNIKTKEWKKDSDFRIDIFCAKQVFESALKILKEKSL